MYITNQNVNKRVAKAMSDTHIPKIVSTTIDKAKSVEELSIELGIPTRSVYRYIKELDTLGILTRERSIFKKEGRKIALYRSMVQSITIQYKDDTVQLDLIPNEGIPEKFNRFWNYLGD